MFGAVNSGSGEQVVILDPQWRTRADHLRYLCANDQLICPLCKQPVWSRTGMERRWHFSHKHLSDCPSSRESPELLQARAVLYEWLVSKFGASAVKIEQALADSQNILPRRFDCTAESRKGVKLAFWVFDRQVKPEEREVIQSIATAAEHALTSVFITSMMRRNGTTAGVLNLNTTERAFLVRSLYDNLYEHHLGCAGSLHYLDSERDARSLLLRSTGCPVPAGSHQHTSVLRSKSPSVRRG